jgi:hypothetical protein
MIIDIMAKGWERSEAVVAQRLNVFQLGGLFVKKIRVLEKEVAILEEDGKPLKKFEKGEHKVAGMFSGSRRSIAFFDVSPKTLRREVKDLWTRDDKEILADVEMELSISDSEKLRNSLMSRKDVVTLEDVWGELKGGIAGDVMGPVVKKKSVDQLQSDRRTARELQVAAEVELRKKLEISGLDLLSFSAHFILPEDYKDYLKSRGRMKEGEEKEAAALEGETAKAVRERELGEIEGTVEDRESVLDAMERERIKREAEMEMEEEEAQHDVRDAVEAMRLKEVKDLQKMARDSKRKKLGLESLKGVSPDGGLEERYGELQEAMETTEKKYFNRKMDKETFTKLMQNYEQEKTELEVKIKRGRKKGG